MHCEKVLHMLEELSPLSYAESWDNPGLLAGRYEKEIKKIYIALDATTEVIEDAKRCGADMLLTHHPLIFKGIRKVNSEDFIGRRIVTLLQADMCYYAMHTNFDVRGMADAAAERLSLEQTRVLDITYEKDGVAEGIGRIGELAHPMSLDACAQLVKNAFGIEWVKVFGEADRQVHSVAVCPGSGKSIIGAALSGKADVLITGDIDHHDGIDALERGMAVMDAGHFGLEQIFVPYMADYIQKQTDEIEVVTQTLTCPFRMV